MRRPIREEPLDPAANTRGFTLIELSIVLVIIGFIIGGILVGQDLIEAAKIRSTMSDIEKIKAAAQTFRTKYNCYPGDCANATDFFGTAANNICPTSFSGNLIANGGVSVDLNTLVNAFTAGTCNSYGDGKISPAQSSEQMPGMGNDLFWDQLFKASLTAQTTATFDGIQYRIAGPITAVNGGISGVTISWLDNTMDQNGDTWAPIAGVYVWPAMVGHNLIYLGYGPDYNVASTESITPAAALAIDTKMDDGLPGTGAVFAEGPGAHNAIQLGASGCVTSTSTTALYDLSQTGSNCNMAFYAGF